MIRVYASNTPGGRLERFDYDSGDLRPGEVEIDVVAQGRSCVYFLENYEIFKKILDKNLDLN